MDFKFTEENWGALASRIVTVGGYPHETIRQRLENDINRIFVKKNYKAVRFADLKRASELSRELLEVLDRLTTAYQEEARSNREQDERQVFSYKVEARLRELIAETDWILDQDYRGSESLDKPRGRPHDYQMLNWAHAMLKAAEEYFWMTSDDRGHTASTFVDLMVALADCAKGVGLNHRGGIRRSILGALDKARKERADDVALSKTIADELDKLAFGDQFNRPDDVI